MGFDPTNMSQEEREELLGDIYGGYKQTQTPRYEMKGAGSGRALRQTGYKSSTNYDYYKDNEKWSAIADQVGITGAINNEQELGTMADYVARYGLNKDTEVPQAVAEEAEKGLPPEVQLSNRAASANAATQAYENVLLNKQGDATIRGDLRPEQDYKNTYQNNLTEELKAKAPTTLANKRAEIEMADKQKADMNDSYDLNLYSGSSPESKQGKMIFS